MIIKPAQYTPLQIPLGNHSNKVPPFKSTSPVQTPSFKPEPEAVKHPLCQRLKQGLFWTSIAVMVYGVYFIM